jgi:SAM-dependent methyltransferase
MEFEIVSAFERVQGTLAPVLDIVAERVDDASVPEWCARRGWQDFLLGLKDEELALCEAEGLAFAFPLLATAPRDLAELADSVRQSCALESLDPARLAQSSEDYRGVSARKRAQVASLLATLSTLAESAERIVDVGSGSGHFARLAAQHFGRATLGLERNPERVRSANARLAARLGEAPACAAQFTVIDALREPLSLRAHDLAIGLHACGELGDTLVTAVADSGADLALISCCLQKIRTEERAPLARSASGLALSRKTLGLSNLTSRVLGVEADVEHMLGARQARLGLRSLLLARGLSVPAGSEMSGINRRRAQAGLADLAHRALAQRGLPPASATEIAHHERNAARDFARVRRLSLPRNMLSRLVELSVVLDRAMKLHEAGHAVRVATVFEPDVTPRNIGLFASRDAQRLPARR